MQDPLRVQDIREKFPSMIAVEMEAAAVAQVCFQYDTPFVIIRALSDVAGKESSISFDEFLPMAAKKDRKSTRLNSSHVAISYAVFCLKKKIIYRTKY